MKTIISRRLSRIRSRIRRLKLDGLLVTDETNVRYLSGFTGDSSALLVTRSDAVFVTDSRYTEQAEGECAGWRIVTRRKGVIDTVTRQAKKLRIGRLGVEAGGITLESAVRLREALGKIEMVNTTGLVEHLREIKSKAEVDAIEECVRAAEQCIERIKPFLVAGIRERDIAAEMEYFVRGLGFEGMAFPTIVAFGARSSLPHARATNRRMRSGDAVLVDWGVAAGAEAGGYVCDLTRVFFHNKIPHRFERIYRTVLEAQGRAIRRIRPGVPAKDVDAAARRHIAKKGFGRRFGHSLGHGIGTQVHEGPTIGPLSSAVLKRGMVFTVEPGVYVPGFGGVRIEDDVLVTAKGVRVLSSAPKGLKDIIL